mmetsp:Transcript_41111/g.122707  ORF Transcript_41111/g.122707 Transcript_41111/m.122707 type:complete len:262 (+) Transcript_41111:907-1692(+)
MNEREASTGVAGASSKCCRSSSARYSRRYASTMLSSGAGARPSSPLPSSTRAPFPRGASAGQGRVSSDSGVRLTIGMTSAEPLNVNLPKWTAHTVIVPPSTAGTSSQGTNARSCSPAPAPPCAHAACAPDRDSSANVTDAGTDDPDAAGTQGALADAGADDPNAAGATGTLADADADDLNAAAAAGALACGSAQNAVVSEVFAGGPSASAAGELKLPPGRSQRGGSGTPSCHGSRCCCCCCCCRCRRGRFGRRCRCCCCCR